MNTTKTLEIENYEIVRQKKDIVITYSLSDCNVLEDLESVNVVAKEKSDKNYDLLIFNKLRDNLVIFKNMDLDSFNSLTGKRVILAGVSEITLDILDVSLVDNINIESYKKMKLGVK